MPATEAPTVIRRILVLQTLPRPLVFSPNNALLTLARHLDRRRYDMTVAVPRAGLLTDALEKEGVRTVRVPGLRTYRRHDAVWRLPVVSLRVAAWARRTGADLLLSNHAELGPFAHAAARLRGIPWICFLRQADRSRRYYEKYRVARADAVGAVSEAALDGYRRFLREGGIAPHSMAAVPTGIDLPDAGAGAVKGHLHPAGWPSSARIVGTVGLREVKRPEVLLEVFSRVASRSPDARCLLVGGAEETRRRQLEALAREKGILDRVWFAGQQREMAPWYGAMHVYANASRSEGFPKAALEAMAHALPVVAFRVGGIPEAVVDGETGLLCDPDDCETLARAIDRLLSRPDEARALGAAGRTRVAERFSPEAMARGMMELFDLAVAGGGRKGAVPGAGPAGNKDRHPGASR
jgi:glycosyltransferase involved in cell wall biosynthesis